MKLTTLKQFYSMIGKKVYRAATACGCASCDSGAKNGIHVYDRHHAEYLHMMGGDCGIEYFNKPLR